MNKKIIGEVFDNLASRGDFRLMILISRKTGLVPKFTVFYSALGAEIRSASNREAERAEAAKMEMPRATLINLAKAMILYGAPEGQEIAIKLKDRRLSSFVLRNIGPDEARMNTTPKMLTQLFKSAEQGAVHAFRTNAVDCGEHKLALMASKFEKVPLSDKEIDTIMAYNRDLPCLPDLIAAAKCFGRKLTESDIKPGIEDVFDSRGGWEDAFDAVEAVGRKLNATEWDLLLEQTRRWNAKK